MEKPLDKLIEHICIKAYCGYAGRLKIQFSIFADLLTILTNDLKEPEWQFETGSAAWRLLENQTLLTGSCDDAEHNDKYLESLIGKKIIEVRNINETDFSLIFQDNFKIETFNHGLDSPLLEFYNTNGAYFLTLSPHGKWNREPAISGLTDDEELLNIHSEQTNKRWKKIVPTDSFDNHCKDCAYFISISGRFYFWDYGLCSNGKSIFDGKVVGIKSSCSNFDYELKQ